MSYVTFSSLLGKADINGMYFRHWSIYNLHSGNKHVNKTNAVECGRYMIVVCAAYSGKPKKGVIKSFQGEVGVQENFVR